MEAPSSALKTGEQVAQYGETIKTRLREWWEAQTDRSLDATVSTFTGPQRLHDFLERQTWHSAQHVRQLEAVLERFGIEPDGRLTDKELEGLPLPKGLWE